MGEVLDKYTKAISKQRYLLLIVNEHYCPVSIFFIYNVERYYIIVLGLVLHFISLQLLDVILFLSFTKCLFKKLLNIMINVQHFVTIMKRIFYLFFEKT